ncbi:hypothetical protein CEUSTIGMA_g1952.t1 [Chlamydomonas eustigma]|uniref:Uncharacterized protein n=1 Tax=Chlamydomonas eustigma TaxID=1157962 RepID=A0A250WUJ3_9CHLO|nr:hypothetical protein CEUSTIGMA_g1952.t1 [Chlamydomonas eustigma]|eukprot:GAX74503.1 hypothetical protein CEUSTIGMA_g1952.t1 [Chlamydomonas eustigma]
MASDASYKGIMLCERPAYTSKESAFIPSSAQERMEPLGINPIRKVHVSSEDKDSPHSNFHYKRWLKELEITQQQMKDHEVHAAEMQVSKKQAIASFSEKLRTAVLNGEKVSTFWKAAKGKSLKNGSELTACSSVTTVKALNVEQASSGNEEADPAIMLKEVDDFVEALCSEAKALREKGSTKSAVSMPEMTASTVTTSAQQDSAERTQSQAEASSSDPSHIKRSSVKSKKRGVSASSSKPAWALSEQQAQEMQLEEEMELLKFAENLDFEEFVGKLDDVELQNTLKALEDAETKGQEGGDDRAWQKSFVRALNQAAFRQVQGSSVNKAEGDSTGDVDNHSEAGFSEGAASRVTISTRARTEATAAKLAAASGASVTGGGNIWDSSSRVGDESDVAKSAAAANRLRAAEEFLMENPELKGVHSTASVRTMLAKVENQAVEV